MEEAGAGSDVVTRDDKIALVTLFGGAIGMAAIGYALLAWNVGMARERTRKLSIGAKWSP